MTYYSNAGLQVTRSRKLFLIVATVAVGASIAFAALLKPASALDTVVVRPSDTQGWMSGAPLSETRTNGTVSFVADADTPFGEGALSLVTGVATSPGPSQDKAQYMKFADTLPLSDVTSLAYSSKQVSASFAAGLPSYQLAIDVDGDLSTTAGFTTLVYEPYNNFGNAVVLANTWQTWDVDAGTFWSSRTLAGVNANVGLTAGFGGAPFYSLADVKAKYPDAVVVAFGVNVGSNNPNYDTRADGVVFNNTLYDFEQNLPTVSTKDECKESGWMNVARTDGSAFTNQGQCVSWATANGNASFKRAN